MDFGLFDMIWFLLILQLSAVMCLIVLSAL